MSVKKTGTVPGRFLFDGLLADPYPQPTAPPPPLDSSESEPPPPYTDRPRRNVTLEQATAMLKPGKRVHRLELSGGPLLLGCDMLRKDALALMAKHGVSLAGPAATRMGHGLAVEVPADEPGRFFVWFFETVAAS